MVIVLVADLLNSETLGTTIFTWDLPFEQRSRSNIGFVLILLEYRK